MGGVEEGASGTGGESGKDPLQEAGMRPPFLCQCDRVSSALRFHRSMSVSDSSSQACGHEDAHLMAVFSDHCEMLTLDYGGAPLTIQVRISSQKLMETCGDLRHSGGSGVGKVSHAFCVCCSREEARIEATSAKGEHEVGQGGDPRVLS